MASTSQSIPGAPTVSGEIAPGAGNTITLFLKVTPDWPRDVELALGHGLEAGQFVATKFSGLPLNFLKKEYTYQDLPKLVGSFQITSQDTSDSKASRVSLWTTPAGGVELLQIAFFIIQPGLQIDTLGNSPIQWHHLEE